MEVRGTQPLPKMIRCEKEQCAPYGSAALNTSYAQLLVCIMCYIKLYDTCTLLEWELRLVLQLHRENAQKERRRPEGKGRLGITIIVMMLPGSCSGLGLKHCCIGGGSQLLLRDRGDLIS